MPLSHHLSWLSTHRLLEHRLLSLLHIESRWRLSYLDASIDLDLIFWCLIRLLTSRRLHPCLERYFYTRWCTLLLESVLYPFAYLAVTQLIDAPGELSPHLLNQSSGIISNIVVLPIVLLCINPHLVQVSKQLPLSAVEVTLNAFFNQAEPHLLPDDDPVILGNISLHPIHEVHQVVFLLAKELVKALLHLHVLVCL